jgi:transcriptional regulator with PAS, ATPase and Fis domain
LRQRDQLQLEQLKEALRVHGGNVARAAKAVQISRQRAYRLMASSEVDLDEVRSAARHKP